MKQNSIFLTILFAFIFTCTLSAQSQKISIQGVLKDSNGAAVADNAAQTVDFALYNVASGGTLLWSETATVSVTGGIYSHLLGSVTDFSTAPGLFGNTVYLNVNVDGADLTPRTELTYSPYTISAAGIANGTGSVSFDNNGNITIVGTNFDVDSAGNIATVSDLGVAGDATIIGNLDVTGNFSFNGSINTDSILVNDDDSGIIFKADNEFSLNAAGEEVITIKNDGVKRVGIHVPNPQALLHVGWDFATHVDAYANGTTNFSYMSTSQPTVFGTANNGAFVGDFITIANKGDMIGRAFLAFGSYTFSDARIKKNLSHSDAEEDLSILNQIKVTDYEYIDKIKSPQGVTKKVIAQELKEVYPNAVSMTRNMIPNVYEMSEAVSFQNGKMTITTAKAHDFSKDDIVSVFAPTKEYENVTVLDVQDAHTFTIAADQAADQVFIYGKYIDDYHTVDYEAIAMLNVSATQELYRMILDLQTENTTLKADNNGFESRLAKLEAMMNTATDTTNEPTRASER